MIHPPSGLAVQGAISAAEHAVTVSVTARGYSKPHRDGVPSPRRAAAGSGRGQKRDGVLGFPASRDRDITAGGPSSGQ